MTQVNAMEDRLNAMGLHQHHHLENKYATPMSVSQTQPQVQESP